MLLGSSYFALLFCGCTSENLPAALDGRMQCPSFGATFVISLVILFRARIVSQRLGFFGARWMALL